MDDVDDDIDALAKAEKDYGGSSGRFRAHRQGAPVATGRRGSKSPAGAHGPVPPDFIAHPHTRKLLENRRKMVDGELGVDWGTAELLAFATLVRLF